MSEKFIPQIKEAQDVSRSIEKTEALHAGQAERIQMLNEHINDGKIGTIITREGKNDLWIRKEKNGVLKWVDAMKPGENIKVLRAEYKIDEKDGQPKLYYYCEVDNTSTVHGGKSGKDKWWIYAGYIHMDIPTPISQKKAENLPPVWPDGLTDYIRRPAESKETPVIPPTKVPESSTEKPEWKKDTPKIPTEPIEKIVWDTDETPYYSKADADSVNVDVDDDDIDKGVLSFTDISEVKAKVLENLRAIDQNNTLQPLFETFSKKANTYPLLWSILLAEAQIHGSDNNGMMTNFGRWLQRDPVYRSGVEMRIQNLQSDYQTYMDELIASISSKDPSRIKAALEKLNDHLSPEKNQVLMNNLASGLSEKKWGIDHTAILGEVSLSEKQMRGWYDKFEQGDIASVYQFTSDKLEARDVLTGTLMQSAKPVFQEGGSFRSIVENGKSKITDEVINNLFGPTFEFMGETFKMPGSVGRGFLGTGTFKDSYAESLQRMIEKTHEQGLSHEDTIKYIEQMFMAEIVMQKEDEIIQKLTEKAKSGKPEDVQKLAMAEQFFKNKSLWTEVGDNWKMYMLKTAAVYATVATGAGFAGGLAEGLALRGAATGLGKLGIAIETNPIASRLYQLGTIQTSLAAGTAISQGDIWALWNLASPKYWIEGTAFLVAFGGLQTGLNRLGLRVSEGLVASRAFTIPRDIIAGMGVMGVNEVMFDGEFTIEEVVNTILFAAAANLTAPKITKKGKEIIVDPVPPETPRAIKWRETLLHENFPKTPIRLADGTMLEAGKFNGTEAVFILTKPGKAPQTVKVGELIKELNHGQRRELYTNTLVKKFREINNNRNELVAKRNKLSDKQDKDENNYDLHTQIQKLNAEIARIEALMKDIAKRANDSHLIDMALNGEKKWPVNPNKGKKNKESLPKKEGFTEIEKAADHGKMRDLEWQISTLKKRIEKAGNPGTENANTSEQVKLNDQSNTLIAELNWLRNKYQMPTYDKSPNRATNMTLNEFSAWADTLTPAKSMETQRTPERETAETGWAKNDIPSETPESRLSGLEKQYKAIKESGREWQRDRAELIRLNDEIIALRKQIAERKWTSATEVVPILTAQERFSLVQPWEIVTLRGEVQGKRIKFLVESNTNWVIQWQPIRGWEPIGSKVQYEISNWELRMSNESWSYSVKITNLTMEIQPKSVPEVKWSKAETTENTARIEQIMNTTKGKVNKRGNTSETSWIIDGVTHVKVVQTGFASSRIQTFEGTRSGDIYTGTLNRNDGRILRGEFRINKTADRNHFDFVNA